MKLSISLEDDLVKRIDTCAKSMSISRSGFLAIAATQYLNQQQMMITLPDMVKIMQKVQDNGMVATEEEKALLEEFAKQ